MANRKAKPKDDYNGNEPRPARYAGRCPRRRRLSTPCAPFAPAPRCAEHRPDGAGGLLPKLPGGLDRRSRRPAGQGRCPRSNPRPARRGMESPLPDRGDARTTGAHGSQPEEKRGSPRGLNDQAKIIASAQPQTAAERIRFSSARVMAEPCPRTRFRSVNPPKASAGWRSGSCRRPPAPRPPGCPPYRGPGTARQSPPPRPRRARSRRSAPPPVSM